ncbi:helix-turn-helix transcriptional regulator [Citrobacter portucalensis]|uniref:helix-turn-helix transcriptional regulator n=1 Tax=Citrobacter portucalensis TaxID=1639133 RepID=UPI0018E385EB|nr:WYL domain-containing protein [Citrobacter portucalensis]
MSKRNTQLALRIADILTRLNNGETLHLAKLAEQYDVCTRTIRRDIEERLLFLELQRDANNGGYTLSPEMLGRFDSNSIERYSGLAGIKGLFPALDKSMLNTIFRPSGQHNFQVHGHKYIDDDMHSVNFPRLQRAIDEQRIVGFRYRRKDALRHYTVEPYKLINYNGIWYLAARHAEKIKHFTLSKIATLECTFERFSADENLRQNINKEESVWASEEKFEVVLKVSAQVAEYFERRQLLNEQVIEKKMADGGLIISTRISHRTEITPVVRYWIPHLKIIAPQSLQNELAQEIKTWLDE